MTGKPTICRLAGLVASLVLLVVLSGCTAGSTRTASPTTLVKAADAGSPASAHALLTASWATDGRLGFFVEGATPADSMSLYDTRWWLAAYAQQHQGALPHNLDRDALRAWVMGLASGARSSAGDAASLPTLERLDDVTAVLAALGSPMPEATLARALGSLQVGDRFTSGAARSGDDGDTAIAIAVYHRARLPVPAAVTTAESARQRRALRDRNVADLLASTVPALSTLPTHPDGAQASLLRAELTWIETQLPRLSVLARMSLGVTLAPLVASVGETPWPTSTLCPGLVVSASGAAPSSSAVPDPQLTANALSAGCLHAQAEPPWTPEGWPSRDAVVTSLPASVDGLRVAAELHVTGHFTSLLRRELSLVWGPAYRSTHSVPMGIAADTLAGQLGARPVAVPSTAEIRRALDDPDSDAALPELVLALVSAHGGPPPIRSAVTASPGSPRSPDRLTVAIVDELRARLTRDPRLHDEAVAVVRSLRTSTPDLYSLPTSTAPSLLGTMFASWVVGAPLPGAQLRAGRVCSGGYWTCRSDDSSILPALQVAAAAAELSRPSTVGYPLAY